MAEEISSAEYSWRSVSRGSPRTPITTIESPGCSSTRGGTVGIETLIPNRSLMATMVAACEGLRQDSISCPTNSRTNSGVRTNRRMAVPFGRLANIESASAKPKYVFDIFPPLLPFGTIITMIDYQNSKNEIFCFVLSDSSGKTNILRQRGFCVVNPRTKAMGQYSMMSSTSGPTATSTCVVVRAMSPGRNVTLSSETM